MLYIIINILLLAKNRNWGLIKNSLKRLNMASKHLLILYLRIHPSLEKPFPTRLVINSVSGVIQFHQIFLYPPEFLQLKNQSKRSKKKRHTIVFIEIVRNDDCCGVGCIECSMRAFGDNGGLLLTKWAGAWNVWVCELMRRIGCALSTPTLAER